MTTGTITSTTHLSYRTHSLRDLSYGQQSREKEPENLRPVRQKP
ncbi:unnamed protein product [Tuber melanosporum]|uniref:(Perigord truffle) hypothetical protein n=1 Tax=Tuber melanosporum (strain Mel28) TaxID=656061 RepID=D5G655_TUBMM|nr:uncharacterized protein GSTUM_00001778001 [Tuber melanosporum]CAZ79998.1 unnamed protein product [Tuber melanosporum]